MWKTKGHEAAVRTIARAVSSSRLAHAYSITGPPNVGKTTLAKALEGTTLTLRGLVGPAGQFYGAISVSQILQELTAVTGHKVERRALELPEPLKEPGTYSVTLRLHHDVSAEINVLAEAENPETTTTVQSGPPAETASNPNLPQP